MNILASLARRYLEWLDRRGWVTWERREPAARVLTVTSAWPRPEVPMLGIFLRTAVDGLTAAGEPSDVLFVRGYLGKRAYVCGALALALLPLAEPRRYRLVNSHGGEAAVVARFFWGAPVLASYWGSDILGPGVRGDRASLPRRLRAHVLRVHALSMAATTTKSREMEGVLPARVRRRNWVIPDGVDRERFRPLDREAARAAVGWPEDELTVISVGRPIPIKRLWLAEQAVALAAQEVPELRWRSISDIPPSDMPLYYNAAAVLVHTSISEGSPNVVKEALACDLPVVATPSGDIPELLEGVEPSELCAPDRGALAAAILRCVRAGTRSNGRSRSERLGLEQVTQLTLACYRSLEG